MNGALTRPVDRAVFTTTISPELEETLYAPLPSEPAVGVTEGEDRAKASEAKQDAEYIMRGCRCLHLHPVHRRGRRVAAARILRLVV